MSNDNTNSEEVAGDRPAAALSALASVAKLMPCPLCGGSAKIIGAHVCLFMSNMEAVCEVCGLSTKSGQFMDERRLIAFWNSRPTQQNTQPQPPPL